MFNFTYFIEINEFFIKLLNKIFFYFCNLKIMFRVFYFHKKTFCAMKNLLKKVNINNYNFVTEIINKFKPILKKLKNK